MTRRNPQLEVVCAQLQAAGIRPLIQINKHINVRWHGPHGEERLCVLANSPGGGRGTANARAIVRRILRQDGVLT